MLHVKFVKAVKYLYPNAIFGQDVIIQNDSNGNGPYLKEWNLPGDPPTDEEIEELLPILDTPEPSKYNLLNIDGSSILVNRGSNIGVKTTSAPYVFNIATSATNDRGCNITVTSTSGTVYGGVATVSGTATTNTGWSLDVSGAKNNRALKIVGPTNGPNNYTIYSTATAKAYFAGSIGIGTTTPFYKIHTVATSTSDNNVDGIAFFQKNSTNGAGCYITASNTIVAIGAGATNGTPNIDLVLNSVTSGIPTERIRITSNGNVGIGLTTPGTIAGGTTLNGEIAHIYGNSNHSQLIIEANGSGKLPTINLISPDATTNKRWFQFQYSGSGNAVNAIFYNEANSVPVITPLSISNTGLLTIGNACNIALDTSTGTKIGTATGQKLSFWNATPVVQQILATGTGATVDNVITFLQTLGLCKQS